MRYVFGGLASCVFALSMAAPVSAVDGALAHNLGLYGGEARDIAVDASSDTIYISTYSPNGFFVSPDNGDTWVGMPEGSDYGEPQGVEVTSDGTAYILSGDGLFVSTDHGVTFTEIGDFEGYGEELLVRGDLIVMGRTDGGVSVSTDAGENFTTTSIESSGATIDSLTLSAEGVLYAVADSRTTAALYASSDNGVSWSAVDTSSVSVVVGYVAASPTETGVLYVVSKNADEPPYFSDDGGITWTALDVSPYASQITFDSNNRVYFGVLYSDDHGASWDTVNQSTPSSRVSGIVVADPADATVLYGASFGAFAKSVDGGETWEDRNEGITAVTVKDMAQSIDKSVVWAATNAGLAKTENFLSDVPTWEFPIHYDFYPESVWVDPLDSLHVVVGGFQVNVSVDGGATWTTATGWNEEFVLAQLLQDPVSGVLYAAAYYNNTIDYKTGGVFQSTDGGLTWETTGFTDGAVQALAITPEGLLYAGAGEVGLSGNGPTGIYSFVDGVWVRLTGSPDMEITSLAVDPNDSTRLYATAADFDTYGSAEDEVSGFYISVDSGVTWERVINAGSENATKFRVITIQDAVDGTRVYLGGSDKMTNHGVVYKSIDGGETWGTYFDGLRNETFYSLFFDGLLAGNSRGAFGLQSQVKLATTKEVVDVSGQSRMRITATLKDKTTDQALAGYRVRFFKKTQSGTWKYLRTKVTGSAGRAAFLVKPQQKARFKVLFAPKGIAAEEYARASRVLVVRDMSN